MRMRIISYVTWIEIIAYPLVLPNFTFRFTFAHFDEGYRSWSYPSYSNNLNIQIRIVRAQVLLLHRIKMSKCTILHFANQWIDDI